MYERFTDRASKVMHLATREEARDLDHKHIGTEHILLGLLREADGAAAQALFSHGVNYKTIRQEVRAVRRS